MKCSLSLLLLTLLAACGPTSEPDKVQPDQLNNTPLNNTPSNNTPSNNTPSNNTPSNNTPVGDVTVDCVSDFVTGNGNYYALTALVTDAGAQVELVHYLAATPTSDPVEAVVFSALVDDARLTPVEFTLETDEVFLKVERAEGEAMYRGTMSGESEFGDTVPATCWPADITFPASYDATTGGCVDEAGNAATNELPWMFVVRTGFGQCTKFEGQLNQEAFGYPTFDFYDLRGADFNDARLNFADLLRSQLEGADLTTFDYGYANVGGSLDEYTRLPADGECTTDEADNTFTCLR